MSGGASGPRPLRWQDAMAERVLEKMHLSDEWRLAFVREVGALFYEAVHTDCPVDCICTQPEGVLHGRHKQGRVA